MSTPPAPERAATSLGPDWIAGIAEVEPVPAPFCGRLDAGVASLALTLTAESSHFGAATSQLIRQRFARCFDQDGTLPVIRCSLRAGTQAFLPHDGRQGKEPVATRIADGWRAAWCYSDVRARVGARQSTGRFSDRWSGLEHALRSALIFSTMPGEALYFHAATLVFDGHAFLLAGSPNAGKSTISREGGAERVVCNELSILARRADGWWALPSPFWGTTDVARYEAPAPLKALTVLTQAPEETVWERLEGAAATQALAPHLGVQAREHWTDPALLGALAQLTRELPTYTLAWKRGTHPMAASPWPELAHGSR